MTFNTFNIRPFNLVLVLALTLLMVCAISATAHAQEVPNLEVSAGVAFTPLVHTSTAPNESFVWPEGARQGFYVNIHKPLNDVYGFEGDYARTTGRFVGIYGLPDVKVTEVFAGPRFSYREIGEGKHVVLYISTLVGAIYRPYLLSYSGWTTGMSLGGGVLVWPTKHVGLNIGGAYRRAFRQAVFDQANLVAGVAFK